MTTLLAAPPVVSSRSIDAHGARTPAPPSVAPSAPAHAAVVDAFVRSAPRNGTLVAGTPLGVAAAFVLNGIAILGGVTNSMTGAGPAPVLPRPTLLPAELVVRRGLGGA
jgi:hypothetical protein